MNSHAISSPASARSRGRRSPRDYAKMLPRRPSLSIMGGSSYRLENMANGHDYGLDGVIKFTSNSSRTSGTVGRLVLSQNGLRFVDYSIHNLSGNSESLNYSAISSASFNNSTFSNASNMNSSFPASSTSALTTDTLISAINIGDVKIDSSRVNEGFVLLILYCQDFSVYEFQLRLNDESQAFVSHIQKKAAKMSSAGRCSVFWHYLFLKYKYVTPKSWEELERSWYDPSKNNALRISQSNERLQVCESLPRSFIVPKGITDLVLEKKMAVSINARRIPVVTYAHNGRFVLMRCAAFDKESATEELVTKVFPLKMIDVKTECSYSSLKNAYRKLREACFVTRDCDNDTNFLSRVGKWMRQLSTSLRMAAEVSQTLSEEESSVLLVEEEDRKWNSLISSLTQVIVDPHRRTIDGLLSLISKEWLYLNGIPNRGLNHANIYHELITLFLDSLHQLVIQNPTAFEYTTKLLIYLYDQLCKQEPDRPNSLMTGSSLDISVSNFYSSDFNFHDRNPNDLPSLLPETVSELLPLYNPFYDKNFASSGKVLSVYSDIITLKFWSSLYLRFNQKPRIQKRASRPPICPQRKKHQNRHGPSSPSHLQFTPSRPPLSSTPQARVNNHSTPATQHETSFNASVNSSSFISGSGPDNPIEETEELYDSSFPEFLYMKFLSSQS